MWQHPSIGMIRPSLLGDKGIQNFHLGKFSFTVTRDHSCKT